jgi:cyclic pyranopterin phosphate synthase
MVDVSAKRPTARRALAEAHVRLGPDAWKALASGALPKGDAVAVARLAGIQAAKRTPSLIPLCHSLSLTSVRVDLQFLASRRTVRIQSEVQCEGKTGVEMEALTAAAVAALALYDMLKALERGIELGPIRLLEKAGGKSGRWRRAVKP